MARRPRRRVIKISASKRQRHLVRQADPVSASVRKRLSNLPTQLTSFIGREREIAELERLLESTRLLTLTGSGGCGKTRLALEVAAGLLDRYPDGVWLVELSSLSDPTLVAHAMATALNIRDQSGRPILAALANQLQRKHLLLILDNCEHLVEACARLTETLLRSCPHLCVLATSREGLGIAGETAWRVPSLSLPDPEHLPVLERLIDYEAVRLFVERAAAASPRPTFTITPRNAPVLAQVCQWLDGIPLAIELAAARIKALSVEQIASRLDDRFRLLAGGSRTALPRHQTLRAAMDWSYQLLSEPERTLLRRISVFAGGFSLEAAEGVCGGGGIDRSDVLDLLLRLVDKSLVVVDDRGGETRYRLLETVRQYGWDRLVEAGESARAERQHRDWYLELTERAEPKLRGPEQQAWFERLEVEHDNLRAALEWSRVGETSAEAGMRLAGALWYFWFVRGYWTEGRRCLEGALARSGEAPPSTLPKALQGAAFLAWRQDDNERSTALGEKGLALCRELGDRENLVLMLVWLGVAAMRKGDYRGVATLFENGRAVAQELGDKWLMGLALSQLGVLARNQGDYNRAITQHTDSLSLSREVGDQFISAYQLRNLGMDMLRKGDFERAAAHYAEGLRLCRDVGDRWVTEECLEGLAGIANAYGHHERASRLFGATEALRELIGHARSPVDQADYDRRVATTRAELGEEAFAAALFEGRRMALEQAIEYGLATVSAASTKDRKTARPEGLLAPREREVAILIAQGLSNREIASRLVISERTAETHVQHILNKLGFKSRTQIATWATQHGLTAKSPPDSVSRQPQAPTS